MVVLFTLDVNSRIPNYKLSVHLEWFYNISSQCSRLENKKKHFADENAINNESTINFKTILRVFKQSCDIMLRLNVKV